MSQGNMLVCDLWHVASTQVSFLPSLLAGQQPLVGTGVSLAAAMAALCQLSGRAGRGLHHQGRSLQREPSADSGLGAGSGWHRRAPPSPGRNAVLP